MTFDEFKAKFQADINAFMERYDENSRLEPAIWPREMSEGDWYDQFLIWMSSR